MLYVIVGSLTTFEVMIRVPIGVYIGSHTLWGTNILLPRE